MVILIIASLFLSLAPASFAGGPRGIENLKYCGHDNDQGERKCYETINKCVHFNLWPTCRPVVIYGHGERYWCLYADNFFLYGCYTKKEVCDSKSSRSPRFACVEV